MSLVLATLGVGFLSALLPFVNVELYLGGVGVVNGDGLADTAGLIGLAFVAALGQTAGKVVWYEVARRGIETAWVQRKLSAPKVRAGYERWSARIQGRPWTGAFVMFLAASGGIPPLLVMAAVAGALKMPRWAFIPTVLVGRTIRFAVVLAGAELLVG